MQPAENGRRFDAETDRKLVPWDACGGFGTVQRFASTGRSSRVDCYAPDTCRRFAARPECPTSATAHPQSRPHYVGFSQAIWRTTSRRFFGSAGRPRLRLPSQNLLNAIRCHPTNVSGFTIASASLQSKNFASATIARRNEAVVRRGLVLRSAQGKPFSEEQVLCQQGD